MAPEIALTRCRLLPTGAVVLDPMAGSGTVLRAAVDAGHYGIGFDVDPLSVLMTRAWTVPVDSDTLRDTALTMVERARTLDPHVPLPWIDEDAQTRAFVDYWFAPPQQADLRRLALLLCGQDGPLADVLRVALSRLVITKDHGASLARDVSHSRPHRVAQSNDFAVLPAFLRAVETIAPRLRDAQSPLVSHVALGDARRMNSLGDAFVDAIITSPPYLNAIDYLRGHRLALVWLGYRLAALRAIRAASVGAERMLDGAADRQAITMVLPALGRVEALPARVRGMVERYLHDLYALLREFRRVLKPGGTATLVVGNSRLHGVSLDNAAAVTATARLVGLPLVERAERELPPNRRYLPPPHAHESGNEPRRMRSEVVLTFSRLTG